MRIITLVTLTFLLLQTHLLWAGGTGNSKLKKAVTIDDAQAAALTNKTERLLHGIRIPEMEFKQANIVDIIDVFNKQIKDLGKTDDAKRITIILEAETEKELMKWEDFGNNSKGIFHLFSFGGLDMSVLEAIQELQKLAKLDSKLDGEKLILSMKKKEK
ncbi:MAG: hypothetical protein A2283_24050 [Lentisphaerae bacterium RIFOXYA12_FULL_48_11]|nr:MAG: hypothetical protein A2283_24050 [Lentisphaerae bacterium RIFOXYA12_FULL_48_11]